MKGEISMSMEKGYNPSEIEPKWYKKWIEKGYFKANIDKSKTPFTIVIPPPNVTGVLHMGHGLNNTIQDILIRYNRMKGKEACWIPGTDHAGIATQTVVEKYLLKTTGKTREEIGREEFLKYVWEWKDKNGNTIIEQLKKIGASCDWSRTRFTMDKGLSNAVKEVFVRLYEKGLIYKGNYIVNWCPRCTTALADDEVEYREHNDKLYYLKYPLKDSNEYLVVATTRPETMLGDTAVAVNPEDDRFKNLIGKKVILPIVNREIPIIADKVVDMEFGTGAVKVTPSHDPNDFDMGKRHNLEFIKVMDEKGKMNDNVPEKYRGMDRYECRKVIMEDLEREGFVEKIEDYSHSVGHCYRCDSVIEPYQSEQWFVKMKPLAQKAIEVVESGKIKFYPERWKKVYLNWMYNIRDWCISRQIWWGHRIPVWYCQDCGEITVDRDTPAKCSKCGSTNLKQEEDVLDTWFSSWLWPFSTLGWPEETEDLKYFYPTDVLVTDPGIIFFWVARMIMAGLEFMNDIPFKDVHIHGVVLDDKGRKMSKSLGNGIDPLEVVEKFGADALRYTIVAITPSGQNLLLSMEKFNIGKHFANKIFNASRYVLSNYNNEEIDENMENLNLSFADKWILSKLQNIIKKIDIAISKYRFQEIATSIYEFFWHQFCDWYLEISKVGLYRSDINTKKKTLSVLFYVLRESLKLLHPIMPFITEEIYQQLPIKDSESIMISKWPESNKQLIDETIEANMEILKRLITGVRNIKTIMNIKPEQKIEVIFNIREDEKINIINHNIEEIKFLANISNIKVEKNIERPEHSATFVSDNIEVFIPLKGLIDFETEKRRIKKKIENLERELEKVNKKLNNENFLQKAKEEAIKKVKDKEKILREDIELYKKNLAAIE